MGSSPHASSGRPTPLSSLSAGELSLCIFGLLVCSSLLAAMILGEPELLHLHRVSAPSTVFALVAAMAGCAVVLRHPALGFLLLVAMLYLDLSEILVRFHRLPSLLQLLVPTLALAAWGDRYGRGGPRPGAPPHRLLAGAATAWLAVVLLSTVIARDPHLADERLVATAKGFVLFVLLVGLSGSIARVRAGLWVLVGCAAVPAGMGIWQTLTRDFGNDFGGLARVKDAHIVGRLFEERIAGPVGDPNYFAQILVMVVPIALHLAWWSGSRRARLAAWAALGTILMGIVFTYSRGGALALGVVLLLSYLDRGLRSRHLAAGAALLVVLAVLAPGEFTRRLATIREIVPGSEQSLRPDSSFQERVIYAKSAWRMYLDHPVLGVGAGNYGVHYQDYADEVGSAARIYGDDQQLRYPHNLYLEVGAETGTLGLLVFGILLAAAFMALHRAGARFQAAERLASAAMCRAVGIGLIGYLVSSLFLHGRHQRYLWLLFALAASLAALSRRAEEET